MNFDDYPLDAHTCQFQVGSYYDTYETVTCNSHFIYDAERQRSLQHFIQIEDIPEKYRSVRLPSGEYAACGFQVRLQRKKMQYIVQVYLPTSLFVIVSWVSFLIKPEVVPGRMALLVTLFLVLINIFNSVR
ncbi:gamma-aminobutyric acid receptor subunit alpha-2-like [Eurytemora carolleeae]|uniref:gamma-aminobutyric acid receptor subunit alpha-2-like n=1 Tax=Eurytemora carolleeae TaxID=1294199 RepID=UPI000C76719A|nr:gamma-aminobutyric acid receptor subunit alpha-2-like [Eurytemora carolleeae]|eukprot:XP_023330425.1 gamma-aminobutyric acid receptor subunit alpha-2-like [Eurytemora affinis]